MAHAEETVHPRANVIRQRILEQALPVFPGPPGRRHGPGGLLLNKIITNDQRLDDLRTPHAEVCQRPLHVALPFPGKPIAKWPDNSQTTKSTAQNIQQTYLASLRNNEDKKSHGEVAHVGIRIGSCRTWRLVEPVLELRCESLQLWQIQGRPIGGSSLAFLAVLPQQRAYEWQAGNLQLQNALSERSHFLRRGDDVVDAACTPGPRRDDLEQRFTDAGVRRHLRPEVGFGSDAAWPNDWVKEAREGRKEGREGNT